MRNITLALITLFSLVGCNQTPKMNKKPTNKIVADTLGQEKSLLLAQAHIQKLGVPPPNQVDSLRISSKRLFDSENCEVAIDTLQLYAKKANWLANLISAGLEPYYSASYDEQKNLSTSRIMELAPYEVRSNKLKKDRNKAYVMIAECSAKLDKIGQAVAYYYSALDLISPGNTKMWDRARKGLYELLQLEDSN